MSHTIRVSDKVYNLILKYMDRRETFSGVIERAFVAFEALSDVSKSLGPAHYLRERPHTDRDPIREAALERADLERRELK